MKVWADFFASFDALDDESERADYLALLHRNFVLSPPGTWPGFADSPPELQDRLQAEWSAWTLRGVQWIPLNQRA